MTPTPGPLGVSPGNNYESWPLVVEDGSDLLVVYSEGAQHNYVSGRKVVAARLTGLGYDTWATETVYDSANDDYTNSIGVDSSGRPLVWILERSSGDVDTGTGQQVLRRREAGSWSTVTTIPVATYTPKIRLIDPILTLANGDMLAHWFGVSDGNSEHGILYTDDDWATHTRITIASGLSDAQRPVEVRFVLLSDGTILGVGRTENIGDGMFQLMLPPGGDPLTPGDWVKVSTNITDQERTPMALIAEADDTLHGYYYDRGTGVLRYRTVAAATVIASPTSWPTSTALVTGGGLDADGGYPSALRDGATNRVVWYSGVDGANHVRVFLLNHTPG